MVPMYIATQLLCQYGGDPQVQALVDGTEFFILPVVNSDGYAYSWPPGDRLWRKNRRDNGDGTLGIDLNRNWSVGFGGEGSSGNTNDPTYRGPSAFSEPETAALRDFFIAHPNIVATVDFHSYSQLVLSPWGYTFDPTPDAALYDALGDQLTDAITSVHGMSYISGPAAATLYVAAASASTGRTATAVSTRSRFIASDLPPGAVVEAGVDGVTVAVIDCPGVDADIDNNGVVDVEDLVEVIVNWGPCPGCPADVNNDGVVNVEDLVLVITNWG